MLPGRHSTFDWGKGRPKTRLLLPLSPLFGFIRRRCCCWCSKFVVRNPALYQAPEGNKAPPLWIRHP